MKRLSPRFLRPAILIGCALFLQPDCSLALTLEREKTLMGTSVQIILAGPDRKVLEEAMDAGFSTISNVEKSMSFFEADSEIAEINRCAGLRPVRVSPDLFGLIQEALSFSELSGGCFDITVGALAALWNFRLEDFRVPPEAQVKSRLNLVGFRKVHLEPKGLTVFLETQGMLISLGGIAKGYAVDKAVSNIRSLGVADGIVSAGGDLMAFGRKGDRELWNVGVKNPRDETKLVCVLPVSNAAVATSGDYERFRIVEGVRYHHILDPRSGYPGRGCMSATVVARNALAADALATAVFVMGPEDGIEFLERLPDTEGVVIDGQGRVRATSGLGAEETAAVPEKEQNRGGPHP